MKLTRMTIVTLGIVTTSMAFAADKHPHEHDHAPKHGGLVVEVRDMDYELVAMPDTIQLYVRDHDKPVDLSHASAKITLLVGTDRQEVHAQPADGKLEARGHFRVVAGTKVIAQMTLNGKAAGTARFVLK